MEHTYGTGNETLHESASFLKINQRTSSVCLLVQPGLPATGICSHSNETPQLRPHKVNVVARLPDPDGDAGINLWTCLLGSTIDWHAN
jgi:hypothetical protein